MSCGRLLPACCAKVSDVSGAIYDYEDVPGPAVEAFRRSQSGAVLVLEKGRLVGILSERDLVLRVIGEGRDPRKTRVSEVMTTTVDNIEFTGFKADASGGITEYVGESPW